MTYTHWFETHASKHRTIVAKLTERKFSPEQIIEYFDFDSMVKHENDFCLLYKNATKCHETEHLNCYWCACPHFRFNDHALADHDGITVFSHCAIHAPLGSAFHHNQAIHHDCSNCTIPHDTKTILKHFSIDWTETMSQCDTSSKN